MDQHFYMQRVYNLSAITKASSLNDLQQGRRIAISGAITRFYIRVCRTGLVYFNRFLFFS